MNKTAKNKNTALVIGGAGFIGSNLVDELIKIGWRVKIIDNLSTGKKENLNPRAEFFQLDIRDLKKIKPVFLGVDFVFHLAALPRVQVSIQDPFLTNDVNINGTLNVLIASRDAKVKKVIYSASSSAYGNQKEMPLREDMKVNPLSPYAVQKYCGELYCKMFSSVYGLSTVCLRYFNVYGFRQNIEGAYCTVIGIFLNQKKNNHSLTIAGDGKHRRDFTSVIDVVKANILAAKNSKVKSGEVINIGRGNNYSVNEVAKMIGGSKKYIAARIEPEETLADNSLAKKILGWQPSVNLPEWVESYKKEIGL